MNSKYRVLFVVVFLLMTLSVSLSYMNYLISLDSAKEQLQKRSLPLSVDNIYTEIQKNIIEPNLVASMMAEDTFLKEWLISREHSNEEIKEYLKSVKNRYGMLTTFLASDKTKNYYSSKGFVEKMTEENPRNEWYYSFKSKDINNEINLDYNEYVNNSMIMFINHKIFDNTHEMIGATGVGFQISYIDEMLKKFRVDYSFKVYFINEAGDIVLYEREFIDLKNIGKSKQLSKHKDEIMAAKEGVVKIEFDSEKFLVNVKYIKELKLYLIVEAKVSNFTEEVRRIFYINLIISILVTLFVTLIILKTIQNYNNKLEHMASYDVLTNLPNRRSFSEDLNKLFLLHDRQKNNLSLLFFDIDDFKKINDISGHLVGDDVLKRTGEIIKDCVRQTDLYARWGGEEFIVAFIDSSLEDSRLIAEKLRSSIEEDKQLEELVGNRVTASFGLTKISVHDKVGKVLKRVDDAMYKAKEDGKNRICIS